jgi:hypothetical protein
LPIEHGVTLKVEKVPETNEPEAWVNFNKRLNDLTDQGYIIINATNTYIILRKAHTATRREE